MTVTNNTYLVINSISEKYHQTLYCVYYLVIYTMHALWLRYAP